MIKTPTHTVNNGINLIKLKLYILILGGAASGLIRYFLERVAFTRPIRNIWQYVHNNLRAMKSKYVTILILLY